MTEQLWSEWEEGVEVYNCNIPLGRSTQGGSAAPSVIRTTVDAASYTSLYKLGAFS